MSKDLNFKNKYNYIFYQLKNMLDDKKYVEVAKFLVKFPDEWLEASKAALIITKQFKEHEIISEPRKKLLERYENYLRYKLI